MPSVIVAGAIANKPGNGGAAWTRLSWVLGFRDLGWDVLFVEQIAAASCVDSAGRRVEPLDSVNAAYFRQVIGSFGLDGASALLVDGERVAYGETFDDLCRRARNADVLINISGNLTCGRIKDCVRLKAYVDLDPGYTQFWNAAGEITGIAGHDCYFTVGENIGRGAAIAPDGIDWRPVRQPVVLDHWPEVPAPRDAAFTTIASWRGPYGRVTDGTTTFGVKAHEFRKFLGMPRLAGDRFEIALEIHDGDARDRASLAEHGWAVADPVKVAGDPLAFRRYVQQSAAEFSVAQGIYVETGSGWFSDRTTRYLASGRPAIVQDTGFSRHYPVGEGLFAFGTVDEAVAAVEAVRRDYARHAKAARALAVERFDSKKVLTSVAATMGLA
jgi:hypothetical protein